MGPNDVNPNCTDPNTLEVYEVVGTDCLGYRDTDGDPHKGSFDRDGDTAVTAAGISAAIDWEIGEGLTLTSITAYDHVDRTQEEDTDSSPNPFVQPEFHAVPKQFTQELRLAGETDKMRWQAGMYYFNWEVNSDYRLVLAPGEFVIDADGDQDTESWSVFGQFEFDVSEQLTVIGGLRYTEEEKEMDYSNVDVGGTIGFLTAPPPDVDVGAGPGVGITLDYPSAIRPTVDHMLLFNTSTVGDLAKHDKNNVTALAELDWKPNDDLLLYAKYSRGVKSAGFNGTFLDVTDIFGLTPPEEIPFNDETLTSYEVGFKSTLLGGAARLNASAFYYDYEDFQTLQFIGLSTLIFNSDAEVYGGEVELQASPGKGWDFILGASYLNATAKDINAPATGTPVDRTMVAAPDITVNGMARYEWPMWNGAMAMIASFYYQDKTYYDIQNFDISLADDYIVGNLRLKWTSASDSLTVSAFVNNIADKEYVTYTFDFVGTAGFNQLHYGKPRWFGGSVRYSWK